MEMVDNLTLDDEKGAVALLIQIQKRFIKKVEAHKWVINCYELQKKLISMIEISLLMLRKVQKIQETMKRCLDVMWVMIDAVAHSSFSCCSANFTQVSFSSLDKSEFEKVTVSNKNSDMEVVDDIEKKREEDES